MTKDFIKKTNSRSQVWQLMLINPATQETEAKLRVQGQTGQDPVSE